MRQRQRNTSPMVRTVSCPDTDWERVRLSALSCSRCGGTCPFTRPSCNDCGADGRPRRSHLPRELDEAGRLHPHGDHERYGEEPPDTGTGPDPRRPFRPGGRRTDRLKVSCPCAKTEPDRPIRCHPNSKPQSCPRAFCNACSRSRRLCSLISFQAGVRSSNRTNSDLTCCSSRVYRSDYGRVMVHGPGIFPASPCCYTASIGH